MGLHPRFEQLTAIARDALPKMRDPATGLFAHKAERSHEGVMLRGENALYSAMVLVGWQSAAAGPAGWLEPVMDRVAERAVRSAAPGLLGAALWALSLADDERVEPALERVSRTADLSATSSMDLGLVLAGLASVVDRHRGLRDRAGRAADEVVAELRRRFDDRAQLFAGARPWRPERGPRGVRNAMNNGFTSFASQVYPLHGLAVYCQAVDERPPPELSRAAETLVASQGRRGQWWWQYARGTGRVMEPYPVYSVHQDAMAFMALAPAEDLGVGRYDDYLRRGLEWVFGGNELGRSLIDLDRPSVWRCIQRRGSDPDGFGGMSRLNHLSLIARAGARGRWRPADPDPEDLEILYECRPYHLGWILYASSLVAKLSAGASM